MRSSPRNAVQATPINKGTSKGKSTMPWLCGDNLYERYGFSADGVVYLLSHTVKIWGAEAALTEPQTLHIALWFLSSGTYFNAVELILS